MTPRTYKRRPATVEAVQWTGENLDEVRDFVSERFPGSMAFKAPDGSGQLLVAYGPYNNFAIPIRHYVQVAGQVFTTTPADVFEATYEPVEDAPATLDDFRKKAEALAPGCEVETHVSGELVVYTGFFVDDDDIVRDLAGDTEGVEA